MSVRRGTGSQSQRGGFLFGLLVALAVIAALAVLAWIVLLPRVVTTAVEQATGLSCDIQRLAANPFSGHFKAEGVRVGNPEGWGDEAMAELVRLEGTLDLLSLRESTLVVKRLEADVARFVIVVDADGRTNLEGVAAGWPPTSPSTRLPLALAAASPSASAKLPNEVLVRQLDLHLMRLEVVDRGAVPARRIGDDLDYHETYQNLRDTRELLSPTMMARLARSPILFNVLLSSRLLDGQASEESGLRRLLDRAGDAVNSFLQGLEQTPKP